MKRLPILLFIVTIALVLVACAPAAQGVVELPTRLQDILYLAVSIVVVFALTQISKWLKSDLSGYAAQVTAAVFGAVMVIINILLAKIPLNLESIAAGILNLIVIVLGSFGFYKIYRQARPAAKG